MLISASRRTDIPAFYAQWLSNRLKTGYCTVPNPFNRNQVSRVSLRPEDVDAIVFWTRNPLPLMRYLDEIDSLNYRYYFLYTIVSNSRNLQPKSPTLEVAVATFRKLSERLGDARRVIWRYDPIVFSRAEPVDKHIAMFECLAGQLSGYTRRCIVSIVDIYGKAAARMNAAGVTSEDCTPPASVLHTLFTQIKSVASQNGMKVFSCAEETDVTGCQIRPGKCIDDELICELFGIDVSHRKDSGQRPACGCVESRDIGMYDTCLYGCQYCYATRSFQLAHVNFSSHDPASPSLIGNYDVPEANQHARGTRPYRRGEKEDDAGEQRDWSE